MPTPNITSTAAYSDGQSASSAAVNVKLGSNGLEVLLADAAPLVWPYGALSTAEPVSAKSSEALITYEHQPGATVYVTNAQFVAALRDAAPHLGVGAQRWQQARPWIWGTAAALAVAAFIHFGGLSPARTIAGLLPDSTRDTIGRNVVASMTRTRPVCTNADGVAALDRLTEKLRVASETDSHFEVTVAKWKLTNAFAAPGETIVLTSQLIKEAKDPSEVAGVLAHEMGHGIARHPETSIVRALGLGAALELLAGGSGGMIAGLGMVMTQLSYSREAETEADATALRILDKANISTKGLSDFFRRMEAERRPLDADKDDTPQKKSGDTPDEDAVAQPNELNLGRFLRSHPTTDERLARIEAAGQKSSGKAMSDADWTALRAICKTDNSAPDAKK